MLCTCQKKTVLKNYWLTISTTAGGTLLWYCRKLLDLGLYCSKGDFFFHGRFNKSKMCMTPVARGTPHHLVRVRQAAACSAWEGTRIRRLERLPKLWMALGVTNDELCRLGGLGQPIVLVPFIRATMYWHGGHNFSASATRRYSYYVVIFQSPHSLLPQILVCSIETADP